MGTPTDPGDNGYEEGNDCQECWGEGLPFGDIPTPKHVVATFAGVTPCDGEWAPDGSYTLTQLDPPNNCQWRTTVNGIVIQWRIFAPPLTSEVYVSSAIPFKQYFNGVELGCKTAFTNIYAACTAQRRAIGGTCVIS